MADHAADPAIAVDEFAQTRGADDLFDDEIIPITGAQEVQPVDEEAPTEQELEPTDVGPQQPDPVTTATTTRHRGGRGRGNAPADGGRGRGRGRGRGGRGSSDTGPKREQHVPKEEAAGAEAKDTEASEQDEQAGEEKKEDDNESKTTPKAESARVQAVRGDRSGTGGVKKPKLTEEELAERMAAAKLNAAKKAAAHARAEADEASFQERERVAIEKRRQELVNRKAMDNERERNRMRKLGAQTGREWDAEKKEDDYNGRRGGSSQFRRGMHGAIPGLPRREHSDSPEWLDELPPGTRDRGRGRGGRGRGRGGAGRGGRGNSSLNASDRPAPQSVPGINSESEFPALPGNRNPPSKEATPAQNGDKPKSPALERVLSPDTSLSPVEGSWAEQVERSEAQ
ncbi:hypothetical protein UA08_08969 [Talaromyces atroroseus]|uniref:Uncharacterized protein n=1 Tax=Talaromyces atroroseus TaxID=1441469 RepID=A0A1Q5Q7C3_TALAT|nr:hypothetical protein UA08_08969 [Talaromyces atroroseus]OKL55742.1 hypothetical protein UA08_08969 [Talaromyces atroroseus]